MPLDQYHEKYVSWCMTKICTRYWNWWANSCYYCRRYYKLWCFEVLRCAEGSLHQQQTSPTVISFDGVDEKCCCCVWRLSCLWICTDVGVICFYKMIGRSATANGATMMRRWCLEVVYLFWGLFALCRFMASMQRWRDSSEWWSLVVGRWVVDRGQCVASRDSSGLYCISKRYYFYEASLSQRGILSLRSCNLRNCASILSPHA